ncbi:hypothetical protein QRE66_25530 [Bacillus cereus]|nr:hypothetical protein QRE66_25530 [Bacillus cereus]
MQIASAFLHFVKMRMGFLIKRLFKVKDIDMTFFFVINQTFV